VKRLLSFSVIVLLFFSCGSNKSVTRLPLSTESIEAANFYHDALQLNAIYKENYFSFNSY